MSALTDAVTQSIIAGMPNSETAMVRDYMKEQIQTQQLERIERKAALVELLMSKLKKAREDNAEEAVIGAYEKLLAQAQA